MGPGGFHFICKEWDQGLSELVRCTMTTVAKANNFLTGYNIDVGLAWGDIIIKKTVLQDVTVFIILVVKYTVCNSVKKIYKEKCKYQKRDSVPGVCAHYLSGFLPTSLPPRALSLGRQIHLL